MKPLIDSADLRRAAKTIAIQLRNHGQLAIFMLPDLQPRTGQPCIMYWYEHGYCRALDRHTNMLAGVFQYDGHTGERVIREAMAAHLKGECNQFCCNAVLYGNFGDDDD